MAELAVIESFVANGGGILIAGRGSTFPNGLNSYPMNSVAKLFGISYTQLTIYSPFQLNGAPVFTNLYPDNVNNTLPYCPSPFWETNYERGEHLRVLRLAVSTMGEYTQQQGGVAATSAQFGPWLEAINETYGREYCVRFELVSNNDDLIFPDPSTDPWPTLPNGSVGCFNANLIHNRQATVIDSAIGAVNYDLSHVIAGTPYGGGCAGNLKIGLSAGLDIPVTRHEMGHQFFQVHTIANQGLNNYETENGDWTIQGGNGQGYAHAVSFHELAENLAWVNTNLGTKIPTGNSLPTVQVGPDVAIPHGTPFTISAVGSDADANDSLTYVWDNMSPGNTQLLPLGNDSKGALFWRLLPTPDTFRTFPRMEDVVANNNSNSQEQLPIQARVMDIRVTVNDNHRILYQGEMVNASGISSDDIRLRVAAAGPFEVTSQASSGLVLSGGAMETVTWNVNGTDTLPVNTQTVSIYLSLDSGFTYPYTLAASVPNSGSYQVVLPNIDAPSARIKVAADSNIYFDLNAAVFEIEMTTVGVPAAAELATISLVPNPAQDEVRLHGVGTKRVTVQVMDVLGRLRLDVGERDHFDVSSLSPGTYFVRISSVKSGAQAQRRLVIVK